MKKGWIKLHRTFFDNPVWKYNNPTRLFLWLIGNVDKDTGSITVGRRQLAGQTHIKTGSIQKTLRYLESIRMVSCSVSPTHTEIRLLNWAKYQAVNETVSPPVINGYQESITKQEYKKKKKKEINKEKSSESSSQQGDSSSPKSPLLWSSLNDIRKEQLTSMRKYPATFGINPETYAWPIGMPKPMTDEEWDELVRRKELLWEN